MIDLYQQVFANGRTEERATVMLKLTTLLMDMGYDTDLQEIENIMAINDTVADALPHVESVCYNCAINLLGKVGLDVTMESVVAETEAIYELLNTILVEIEDFEDYESLLAILESGEPDVVVVSNMVGYLQGKYLDKYVSLIESVQPKLLRVIKGILDAKATKDYDEGIAVNKDIANQVACYMRLYPDSPVHAQLADNGYLQSLTTLLEETDLADPEMSTTDLAVGIVGLILSQYPSVDECFNNVEPLVEQHVPADEPARYMEVGKKAQQALKYVFDKLNNNVD